MATTIPEDPWLRGLAVGASGLLFGASAFGAGQWVAAGLALVAGLVPHAGARLVGLAGVAVVGLWAWPPAKADLPPLGLSTALALALGGALLARWLEPGLRRPRNLAGALTLALLVSLVVPYAPRVPTELDERSAWAATLLASVNTSIIATSVMALSFTIGPVMTLLAWRGPDAGLRRRLPPLMLAAPLFASLWPLLLTASSRPPLRLVAGMAFLALAGCAQAVVAALAVASEPRDRPPPGVVYLDDVNDSRDEATP